MAAKHEAQQTTDHQEIRRWVEAREGRPATVKGTEDEDDAAGLLRIAFRDDVSLQTLGWDEFFEKFEDEDLAFLYQEETKDGKRSRFFKFVERE
ncbi:MAG: hypothetical protein KY442_10980 [Proteobacteria bacterium]|nr:hypothetical protein [Pseudomonadota bacterium]